MAPAAHSAGKQTPGGRRGRAGSPLAGKPALSLEGTGGSKAAKSARSETRQGDDKVSAISRDRRKAAEEGRRRTRAAAWRHRRRAGNAESAGPAEPPSPRAPTRTHRERNNADGRSRWEREGDHTTAGGAAAAPGKAAPGAGRRRGEAAVARDESRSGEHGRPPPPVRRLTSRLQDARSRPYGAPGTRGGSTGGRTGRGEAARLREAGGRRQSPASSSARGCIPKVRALGCKKVSVNLSVWVLQGMSPDHRGIKLRTVSERCLENS